MFWSFIVNEIGCKLSLMRGDGGGPITWFTFSYTNNRIANTTLFCLSPLTPEVVRGLLSSGQVDGMLEDELVKKMREQWQDLVLVGTLSDASSKINIFAHEDVNGLRDKLVNLYATQVTGVTFTVPDDL